MWFEGPLEPLWQRSAALSDFQDGDPVPKKRWNAPCPHVNKQLEERALHGRRGSLWDEIAVVTAWLGLVKHCKSWASSSDSQQHCMGNASDAGSPIRDRVRRGICLSSDIYGQLPVRRWNQQFFQVFL